MDAKPTMHEYHNIEIEVALQRMRDVTTHRLQLSSFFGTTNVTVLTIAIGIHSAGLIMLAACTVGVAGLVDR